MGGLNNNNNNNNNNNTAPRHNGAGAGAGGGAGGGGGGLRDPFMKFFPPGSSLNTLNQRLCEHVQPLTLGGVVFQPALIVMLALLGFLFGLRVAIGALLVAFLLG